MGSDTPLADGFHMPGEFAPHTGVYTAWPNNEFTWRADGVPGREAFVCLVRALAEFEDVTVLAGSEVWCDAAAALEHIPRTRVVEMALDDAWMRDTGPTCVVDGRGGVRAVNWEFNAWGGLYSPCILDALAARKVAQLERLPCYDADFVLEGMLPLLSCPLLRERGGR